jgi:hypothetical protein
MVQGDPQPPVRRKFPHNVGSVGHASSSTIRARHDGRRRDAFRLRRYRAWDAITMIAG